MKKEIFLKCFSSLIVLIAIVNCIFEIINIAAELDVHTAPGTYCPISTYIQCSFKIILNVIFVAIIILILISLKNKTIDLKSKKSLFLISFIIFVVSCLFIYCFASKYYQFQTLNLVIDQNRVFLENVEMIKNYEKQISTIVPLFFTYSLMYLSYICEILVLLLKSRKSKHCQTLSEGTEQ